MAISIVTTVRENLHRIRVLLYVNNLLGGVGRFFARTANEASLTIEKVCAALKNRGGFLGSFKDLVDNAQWMIDEAIYQLLDGYSVNFFGYFTIYPHVTGTFDSASEPYDKKKNPIKFRFRVGPKLRRLIDEIEVSIEGVANVSGSIDTYIDTDEDETNGIYVPGNQFVIYGSKIKIEGGNNPNVGLFFVPVGSSGTEARVSRIAINTPGMLVGVAPHTGAAQNRLEVRTTYSGSGNTPLKEPRTITSQFILEEV
jgi:hypothetical protein